jgi:hypothetical protein
VRSQEVEEVKKRLAQELIFGWTHTKVRSQEVKEVKKRLAQELIFGWTHTKVRSQEWRMTRRGWLKSLSLAGPIPR